MQTQIYTQGPKMKTPPTVVLELVDGSPPRFKVIAVDERLIAKDNILVGELLSDSDVDFLLEAYGDFEVEVLYPRQPGNHSD